MPAIERRLGELIRAQRLATVRRVVRGDSVVRRVCVIPVKACTDSPGLSEKLEMPKLPVPDP